MRLGKNNLSCLIVWNQTDNYIKRNDRLIVKAFREQAKKDYQILNEYDCSEFMKLKKAEEFLSGLLHESFDRIAK